MVAQHAPTRRPDPNPLQGAVVQLVHTLTVTMLAMLLLLALWLVARRLGGELKSPLSFPVMLLVVAALAAAVSLPPRPSVVISKFSSIPWKPAAITTLPSCNSFSTRSVEIDLMRALVCVLSVRMPICAPVRLTAL